MNGQNRPSSRDEFKIAVICALTLEANAIFCSLDEIWHDAPQIYRKAPGDPNHYIFGRSGRHPVVVVTLPGMGNVQSSGAAAYLSMSFVSIELALLVGICGAVPSKPNGNEIILGDVIMSEVLVRLDFGGQYPNEFRRKDTILDRPGKQSNVILSLLRSWQSPVMSQQLQTKMMEHLVNLMCNPYIDTDYPTSSSDLLFDPEYIHKHHDGCFDCIQTGSACITAVNASCEEIRCDPHMLIPRLRRAGYEFPQQNIHFGSIGTADTVMKSARHRDQLAASEGIIAFEMEGAGVWDKFSCLIIKGVCDYADSHKNKKWQRYAAAVAAAAAREVLNQFVANDRSDLFNSSLQYSPREALAQRAHTEAQNREAANHSAPRDSFDKIAKDFEKTLSSDQVGIFRGVDLRSFKKELKHIQDEQLQARALRNMRRIEQFMERIEALGEAVHNLLGSNDLVCLIWGSARALFRISKGQNDLLDRLLSAYEEIGDELPLIAKGLDIFQNHIGFQRLLARILADVLKFHSDAMKIYSAPALKTVFKSFWQNYEPSFKNTLRHMRAYKTLIEDRTRMTYIDSEQASKDTMEIRRLLQQVDKEMAGFEMGEIERQEKNFHAVRNWIAATETETEHKSICRDRSRYQGSGTWILDEIQVKEWIDPEPDDLSKSLLWINGRPGTGKTYLASVLIEACLQKTDCTTCYFYCSEETDSRTSLVAILRGILSQLICRHNELIPYCYDKMKNSSTPILSDLSIIKSLLETFHEIIPRWYVVIDGLDECTERKDVLETFTDLVKTETLSSGRLRVAFLSQPTPEIKKSLLMVQVFVIEPENTKVDIQTYCQHRTQELAKYDFGNDTLKEVAERICIRANGIFLFAKLVMNNLAKQPNRRRFQIEIDSARLPNELNEAYTRIMERLKQDLSEEQLEYTRLLLGWLVCSKRPLKWSEIQAALSIDLQSRTKLHELDTDLRLRDDVQELCGSLVQVLKGNRVELVHSTARLFIANHSQINIAAAECDLTLRCLRYLTLEFFRHDIPSSKLREYALRGDLDFQDYAVSQWYIHMRAFIEYKDAFLEDSIMARETNTQSHIALIDRELSNFIGFYGQDLPVSANEVSESSHQDCVFFQNRPFYESLVRIWDHICFAQRGDTAARNKVSLEYLKGAFTRNRALIEELSSNFENDPPLLYDEYPYRCPRVLCFYFHEGFKSADVRQNHVNHHDHPYQCPVENCAPHIFGFRSKSALRSHMLRSHPEECDLDESFTLLSRRQVDNSRWVCRICNSFFARKPILDDHMRAHTGEKPFCCSECGRGFARKNDMKRHEKIHERRRT